MFIREERGIMSGRCSCSTFFKKVLAAAKVIILLFSTASHQRCRFLNPMSQPNNIQREVIMNLGLAKNQSCNIHISCRAQDRITISPGSSHTCHGPPRRPPPPSFTHRDNVIYSPARERALDSPANLPLLSFLLVWKSPGLAIFITTISKEPFRTYSLVLNLSDSRNNVPNHKDASRTGRGAKFLCDSCRKRRKGFKVRTTYCVCFLIQFSAIKMIITRKVSVRRAERKDPNVASGGFPKIEWRIFAPTLGRTI